MAGEQEPATNWAQAQHRINAGEAGDKVAYSDPATTPLGTDAEAGGARSEPALVAQNMRNEQQAQADPAFTRPGTGLSPWVYVGVGVAVLAVAGLLFAAT